MNRDPLLFPADNFTEEAVIVKTSEGEKNVTYRAYMHLPYVKNPVDADYQSLNVKVPVSVDGVPVDASEAPILLSIRVFGYMPVRNKGGNDNAPPPPPNPDDPPRMSPGGSPLGSPGNISNNADLALAAGYVVVIPGCRGRDNQAADGTYYGKAPAAVVDLKAAIRYIRHNKSSIPGNTDWIITSGLSAGGALSALLGASGNSPLFDSRLKEIGAADESDNVFASGCFCPVMDLEHADAAYEWMRGKIPRRSGKLIDQTLSKELADLFPAYQKSLALEGRNGFGILTAENYGQYILSEYLIPSANKFLSELSGEEREIYLSANPWLAWNGKEASFTFEGQAVYAGRSKGLPAHDDFDLQNAETILFGSKTENARHFTEFSLRHATGDPDAQLSDDVKHLVKLMNPMYFLGLKNEDCAGHWWIRHGTLDIGSSTTVVANLAASLENLSKNVNMRLYWDGGHASDEDPEDFIAWIAQITGYKK